MKKRRIQTDCLSRSASMEDIMDPNLTPRELARISPTERRKELLEILELTAVAVRISGRSTKTIERLALLVGKSVSMSIDEKRRTMTCPALLGSPRLWMLINVLQAEQQRLEKLHERFRMQSVA
jgi:hypothetical protein